ncbi:hypothetical protein K2173_026954 [Erythroxylum novogranatense]|uniref:Cysteine-rich receptor-like protein kinase 1 n=1 Tax=Erythroxylum novogranatense TaxID=1862640 RepID=A0AAV8TXM8_9ROSI|nr:hypothetical protein K2173_026954 [Erythroxylum novogranatense]
MQVPLKFSQHLIWVFLIIASISFSFLLASPTSEIHHICGSSDDSINSNASSAIFPNFVIVMDSLMRKVANNQWADDSVTITLPEVYALAQCFGYISNVDCKLCFSEGRVKLPSCLPAYSGRIYFEGCFLRYGTNDFFQESVDPNYDSTNCSAPSGDLADTSLHNAFKSEVAQVILQVTELALKNGSFGTVASRGGVLPVYALSQCWESLNKDACRKCLTIAGLKLTQCAPGSEGKALFTGCYMKYSTERFFYSNLETKGRDAGIVIAIVLSAVAFLLLSSIGAFIGYRRLSKKKEENNRLGPFTGAPSLNFKYEVLEKATDFFHESRKLGQGGAGSVFKGTLPDGTTVAVKRLVFNTRQWVDQFFNEVNLISGIQHPNLVSLLGCSIEGPESLLVYEYVPNRGLDQILFINNTIQVLSWKQRFSIILGTAQGLAYLHGGCAVKIIHRDIKTSNILLDENLTPKIADFGLVRCAPSDNSHISTGIAGTLGYVAPEYLIKGQLTEKVDVYGFGVLVLEIATGKKNSVYSQGSNSILHSVWKNYKARTITNTIFPGLYGEFPHKQAANVLQVGLLCTQASASLRPSMAEVVQMLTDEECELPSPKQPPFLNASVLNPDDSTQSCITKVSLTQCCVLDQQVADEVL